MSEKAASLRAIRSLVAKMQEPLDTAIGLAHGLDLIAQELNTADAGASQPIMALAALLADRLALVQQTWRAIGEASSADLPPRRIE
ncbi:MAG TPA: hypothetical protein VG819_02420 [Rhizomicrobium sp.]|jgi:hypothetical protein|nr:hypothetical protein [Rhizomicrobium sp.]